MWNKTLVLVNCDFSHMNSFAFPVQLWLLRRKIFNRYPNSWICMRIAKTFSRDREPLLRSQFSVSKWENMRNVCTNHAKKFTWSRVNSSTGSTTSSTIASRVIYFRQFPLLPKIAKFSNFKKLNSGKFG
jgi:hypothetical protein